MKLVGFFLKLRCEFQISLKEKKHSLGDLNKQILEEITQHKQPCQLFGKFGIDILNDKFRIGPMKYSNPRNDRQDKQGSKAEQHWRTSCFASVWPPPGLG